MLALFLILLSFGSYCSSAPTKTYMRTRIAETRTKVDSLKNPEFQDLLTPTHKMEERCTLKKLNIFIESLKSFKPSRKIQLLINNLESIQKQVETDFPEFKESEPDCDGERESFENFTKKLSEFLRFITEKFFS